MVQKYMRGLLLKRRSEREMLDTKLMNCHNFFKSVKQNYQEDAAVKMQCTIRRWLKSIKDSKELKEKELKQK